MSDTKTVVALVGNPNCGKTTLFNELTGSNYDVGNRIGVTVESKKGICRYNKNMLIVDLPGIAQKICTGSKSACHSGGSPCCCSLRHGGCAA